MTTPDQMTRAEIEQYTSRVMFDAQQRQSNALFAVDVQTGYVGTKAEVRKRIGKTTINTEYKRHGPTQYSFVSHDSRWISFNVLHDAQRISEFDKARTGVNWIQPLEQNQAFAFGRKYDTIIVDAHQGIASTGPRGEEQTPFLQDNIIGVAVGANGATGMNLEKLLTIEEKILATGMPLNGWIYVGITSRQRKELQGIPEIVSIDFNSYKPFGTGTIQTFSNMMFIPMDGYRDPENKNPILPIDENGIRSIPCWTKDAIEFGIQKPLKTTIAILHDQQDDTSIFTRTMVGATRRDEELCVTVLCQE